MRVEDYNIFELLYKSSFATELYLAKNKKGEKTVIKFFKGNDLEEQYDRDYSEYHSLMEELLLLKRELKEKTDEPEELKKLEKILKGYESQDILKKRYKQVFKNLFIQEAKILQTLTENRTPNVVRLKEYRLDADWETDTETKAPFIATEYVNWPNCTDLFYKTPSNKKLVKAIGIELLNTISRIHKLGYIHMDISPNNVLINPEKHELILLDFGITRKKGEHITLLDPKKGLLLGTAGYISPHHFGSDSKAEESYDLYAISRLLLYLQGIDKDIEEEDNPFVAMQETHNELLCVLTTKEEIENKKISKQQAEVLINGLKCNYKTAEQMLEDWKKI